MRLKELIKQVGVLMALNSYVTSLKDCQFFLQGENGAMMIERSPLRDLLSHVDGSY